MNPPRSRRPIAISPSFRFTWARVRIVGAVALGLASMVRETSCKRSRTPARCSSLIAMAHRLLWAWSGDLGPASRGPPGESWCHGAGRYLDADPLGWLSGAFADIL